MTHKTKNLLIADDNPIVHQFIAKALTAPEFHIIAASDGVEALKLIDDTQTTIDILLVDVIMPRLNGPELVRVVLAFHPHIKIIFISGYPDYVLEMYGIPASKIRYLTKPLLLDDLTRAVREELSK